EAREGGPLSRQGRWARARRERVAAHGRGAAGREGVAVSTNGVGARNGSGAAILRAEHLVKSYAGRRVVDDVSVEVRAGEIVGLLGRNGGGRTTSFYMIVGLARPDTGVVTLNGDDVTALPMYERARRGIGYLPQEPSIFRKLTVEQNVLAILETLDLT